MNKINDGGQAFPSSFAVGPCGDLYPGISGMSLRDWFAGRAISAVIAATSAGQHNPQKKDGEHIRFAIARDAYEMADAMLAAREAQP